MKADCGFIEHVENTAEVGAQLGGKADALGLSARESLGGAPELQVAEANLLQEVEALLDLRKDVTGNGRFAARELEGPQGLHRIGDREESNVLDREVLDANGAGHFVQTGPSAVGAFYELGVVGTVQFAVKVDLGFRDRVVRGVFATVESTAPGSCYLSVTPACRAPAAGGIERKMCRVGGLEGAAGNRADPGS